MRPGCEQLGSPWTVSTPVKRCKTPIFAEIAAWSGLFRTWPAVCIIFCAISISQLVLNEIAWGPGDPGTGAPSFSGGPAPRFPSFACAIPRPSHMKATLQPRSCKPGTTSHRMSDDIRYNKTFDLMPGQATDVAPGVRAVVANNPG